MPSDSGIVLCRSCGKLSYWDSHFGCYICEKCGERTSKKSVCVDKGKVIHASWRDRMLEQGREVSPERMSWDTLLD